MRHATDTHVNVIVATLGPNRQLFLVLASCLLDIFAPLNLLSVCYGIPNIVDKVDLLFCVIVIVSCQVSCLEIKKKLT